MRYLGMFFLTLALLAGCTNESNPVGVNAAEDQEHTTPAHEGVASAHKATSSTVHLTIPLNGIFYSPCVEEEVRLAGPVAARIHTTIDGHGVMHQNAYFNWKDVVATGLESGTTWYTTAAAELYNTMNQEPIGPPFEPAPTEYPAVFHHSGAIRFHSDSDAPNLYVHHLVQNVVDAQGNVRVETDLLEVLECR